MAALNSLFLVRNTSGLKTMLIKPNSIMYGANQLKWLQSDWLISRQARKVDTKMVGGRAVTTREVTPVIKVQVASISIWLNFLRLTCIDVGLVTVAELLSLTGVDGTAALDDTFSIVANSIHSTWWPFTLTIWQRSSSSDGQIIRDSQSKVFVCR